MNKAAIILIGLTYISIIEPNNGYYDFFKNNYQYNDNSVQQQNDLINKESDSNINNYENNDLKQYYDNYYEFDYYDKYYDYFKYKKSLD